LITASLVVRIRTGCTGRTLVAGIGQNAPNTAKKQQHHNRAHSIKGRKVAMYRAGDWMEQNEYLKDALEAGDTSCLQTEQEAGAYIVVIGYAEESKFPHSA
jgi:hypothetical protein